jgi:penicillin-binding protein 1A
MAGSRLHARPSAGARGALTVADGVFRGLLLGAVVGIGSVLFAAALLPPFAAGGRAVEEFAHEFNEIGADVDLTFPTIPERSTIYAADGSVLATLYLDENRDYVRLHRINDITRKAVLAIEDSRFYEHPGLDLKGIVRALVTNLQAGEIEEGASTITQQLARNVFPKAVGDEETLARKILEARVADRLEDEYSKDEILELYLNDVYFGRGVYGIATAAEFYFGRGISRLTLPQAALLAGLISAPETYSPVNDREAARRRRDVVLERMRDLGWITGAQSDRAMDKGLELDITKVGNGDTKFPYFVEYLKAQILEDRRFGKTHRARVRTLFQGGLKIYTTLEPDLQQAGENMVAARFRSVGGPTGAIAAVHVETGKVLALIGGKDFDKSQVNLATGQGGSGRQSGSAFKPFTLVAALEQGIPIGKVYNAASGQRVNCAPYGPSSYTVVNAGDSFGSGHVNLLQATAGSINAVFVQLAIDVGPPKIVDVAHRMGIESHLDPYCTVTLGVEEVTPLEMASAFTTLANHGVHCQPVAITEVRASNNRRIFKTHKRCEQVIDAEIADKVAGMLRLVVTSGTGTAANLGTWPVFGKTGTTNDSADVWFDGCTRQICAATWVGYERGRVPMPGAYGGTVAAPIWHDFMGVAMRGLPALGLPDVPVPAKAKVPDVVGLSRDQAVDILVGADFTPSVATVDSGQPAGTVVSQSPGGGTTATAGSVVTIGVSTGRSPSATVPNVVGLSQGQATSTLNRAGFGVSVSSATTPSRSLSGTVKAQSPGSGARADPGATVHIVVYRYRQPSGGGGGGNPGGGNPGGGGGNPGGGRGGGNPGGGGGDD